MRALVQVRGDAGGEARDASVRPDLASVRRRSPAVGEAPQRGCTGGCGRGCPLRDRGGHMTRCTKRMNRNSLRCRLPLTRCVKASGPLCAGGCLAWRLGRSRVGRSTRTMPQRGPLPPAPAPRPEHWLGPHAASRLASCSPRAIDTAAVRFRDATPQRRWAPSDRRALFLFPTVCMAAWIRSLFQSKDHPEEGIAEVPPFDLSFSGIIEPKPPATIIRRERFRVCLYPAKDQRCDECSRPGYWLAFEFLARRKWRHLLVLHESELPAIIALLHEVISYLEAQTEESLRRSGAEH